uniref:DNA-directed RNA polymerase subunit beta'' n=1 Tax=Carteria sp. SAG 8-5 TaxID=1756294 RepID=A0A0S2LPJ5_9CHLO|nr:beta'' subunit of RNA polymerase [Carteria sp. SAG 8-5]
MNQRFWNQCFDKGRLKNFVLWFFANYGEHKTVELLENFKNIGFEYATKAGISLGIDDLKIPPKKTLLMAEAEQQTRATINQYKRGEITGVERFQRLIDTWHRTSESLKQEVIDHFQTTDILNPVYMMAFSGARGNVSQVRQLVGMRGLMADPQGQILDFPIRSNFREGLTLTEYIISCYGARKGIVDTALRTANAGYLTRRLVDVAQHVIVAHFDCGTKRGIVLTDMKEGNKTIYSLTNRLVGRVLAKDVENIGFRNQEISTDLAVNLAKNHKKIFVRSPLTCESNQLVCQLCYGWSLAQGNLVSIGEAVGIIAAQSIGEPGTQLTMRTFHTGGVFAGDVTDQIKAPYDGIATYPRSIPGTLIRTSEGKIAFLTKSEGMIKVENFPLVDDSKLYKIPPFTVLFVKNGEKVYSKQVIAQISNITKNQFKRNEAERCVNAEIDGEVFFPNLKTKELLSVLKKGEDFSIPQQRNKKQNQTKIEEYTNVIKKDFSKIKLEKEITDALKKGPEGPRKIEDWTSGSVLAGKIYQTPIPAHFFPKEGDYIGKTVLSNGEKRNRSSLFSGGILNGIKWLVDKNVCFSSSFYYFKKPLFSIAIHHFCYKKTGYFFTTKKNDSFFITKPFFPDECRSSFFSAFNKDLQTRIAHLEKSKFFLEWFPKNLQTNSSGLAYNGNQLNSKSNRDIAIFSNKKTAKTKQLFYSTNDILNLLDLESQSLWIPEKSYQITNQVGNNTRIFGSSVLFKEKNILFINRQGRKKSSSKIRYSSGDYFHVMHSKDKISLGSFENIKKNDLFKICSIRIKKQKSKFDESSAYYKDNKIGQKKKISNLKCRSNFESTIRSNDSSIKQKILHSLLLALSSSHKYVFFVYQKLCEYWTSFWTPSSKDQLPIICTKKKKIKAAFLDQSRKITTQIKQRNSWYYFKICRNENNNSRQHKKTLFPGQVFLDDIIFDKNIVYVESCFLSKENQPSLLSLAQKISESKNLKNSTEFGKQYSKEHRKDKTDKSGIEPNFIKWYKNKKSRFEPKTSDSQSNNLKVEHIITIDPVIEYTHNNSYKKFIKVFISNEPFESFINYQKNHSPQKTKTKKFSTTSFKTLSIFRHIRFRAFNKKKSTFFRLNVNTVSSKDPISKIKTTYRKDQYDYWKSYKNFHVNSDFNKNISKHYNDNFVSDAGEFKKLTFYTDIHYAFSKNKTTHSIPSTDILLKSLLLPFLSKSGRSFKIRNKNPTGFYNRTISKLEGSRLFVCHYQKGISSQFARLQLNTFKNLESNNIFFTKSIRTPDEGLQTRKTYDFTSCYKPFNIQPQFIGFLKKNSVAVFKENPKISFHRSFQCETIQFGKDLKKTLGKNKFFNSTKPFFPDECSISPARVFPHFLFDFSLYQKTDYEQKDSNKNRIAGEKSSFKNKSGLFVAFQGIKTSTIFNRKKYPGKNSIFTNESALARTAFLSPFEGEILKLTKSQCLILTNTDQISFYHKRKVDHSLDEQASLSMQIFTNFQEKTSILTQTYQKNKKIYSRTVDFSLGPPQKKLSASLDSANYDLEKNKNHANIFLGDFLVYGDLIKNLTKKKMEFKEETNLKKEKVGLKKPGQIIHLNKSKITLRRTQPIFLSPNTILHSFNGDFVEKNTPLMTLPYQVLTTGDIVQGIPKIEQLFEARTTKNGRFFKESIPNFLIALYQRYKTRLPLDQAVRQSFYKIQQIIIDGVQRVYRSQGVTIADKHIEIIVKQMTSKILVVKSGQTGFLPGEILDLEFVETLNQFLIKKIRYEPIILGITKASLEVDSFLSAASFQQTTKVLSRAAISKKRDFLKGLKENVIVGNLIPAGTGYIKEKN